MGAFVVYDWIMKRWQLKEKSDEKTFKGKRTTGSGNRWYAPGDVRTDNLLIENKQTDNASYSITTKVWKKIEKEALFAYRLPMMSIQIQDVEVVVLSKKDFVKFFMPTLEGPTGEPYGQGPQGGRET